MARRMIAEWVFRFANQQAAAEGKQVVWKKEIGDGWKQFCLKPSHATAVRLVSIEPTMWRFFDNTFQRSTHPAIWTATTFSFDGYSLPRTIADIEILTELSEQDYALFPRRFEAEAIYRVSPIRFMGREWEFMISSVSGQIYKWAASLAVGRDEDSEIIGDGLIDYCVRWLGAPTEERLGCLIWDTSDGNVILQLTNTNDWFDLSVFITSREIRNLTS